MSNSSRKNLSGARQRFWFSGEELQQEDSMRPVVLSRSHPLVYVRQYWSEIVFDSPQDVAKPLILLVKKGSSFTLSIYGP